MWALASVTLAGFPSHPGRLGSSGPSTPRGKAVAAWVLPGHVAFEVNVWLRRRRSVTMALIAYARRWRWSRHIYVGKCDMLWACTGGTTLLVPLYSVSGVRQSTVVSYRAAPPNPCTELRLTHVRVKKNKKHKNKGK